MINKIIDFLILPFRFKIAKRLNRMQHLKIQLIAFLPMMLFILLLMATNVNLNDSVAYEQTINFWIGGLVGLHWMVISIRVGIARLHDCNHSGWWILFIICLSTAALFPIFLLCLWSGSKEENNYGKPSHKIWVLRNTI